MAITGSQSGATKTRLLDAALTVIRTKGYSATTVDDICENAGLTKGAFFHHFKAKEELAVEAAAYWGVVTSGAFASAAYRSLADPLDRLLAYVDFRKAILQGELPEFTCFAGTVIQEVYESHPRIREACEKTISDHAATVELDIAEAMRKYGVDADWTAKSLALYIQAVLQGAFVLAKAQHSPEVAAACIDHLRRYLEMLFARGERQDRISGESL
jgi:TetR/AcrR family transcriptional repressor of nem operon